MDSTCKSLHLAFKNQTTEDIYDTLVFCFVKAARRYDPYYADKIKQVCEVVRELPKQFTIEQLEARVGFDCTGILRYLVCKDLLVSVVVGYELGSKWSAPVSFFESGPIGFAYVNPDLVQVTPQRVDRTSLSPDWVRRYSDRLVAGLYDVPLESACL